MPTSPTLSLQAWLMLFIVAILIFLMNVDYTAVNLALIPISEEIHEDLNLLQWLISGYVLIWAAFVVPAGRLADLYGKNFALMGGLILFMIGSILTGIGHNVYLLIIGRLLQGLGAAIFSAPAYGLIFTSIPIQKHGMAMGIVGGASGLGLATGPSLTGWIIKELGWRWIFYVNIPLCLSIILGLYLFTPEEDKSLNKFKIDWFSVTLLTFGLGSIVFALNQIEIWGFDDVRLWTIALSGILGLGVFAFRNQTQTVQVFPKTILNNKPFIITIIAGFIASYCFALVLIMMSLYLQSILKLSPSNAGTLFLSMTLSVGLLSPVGGKLADYMDIRYPAIIGSLLTTIALYLLSFVNEQSSYQYISLGLLIAGVGLGIGFPSLNTVMFRTLPSENITTGSAIFTMAMMLGNSLSVIISTSLLVIFGKSYLASSLLTLGITLTKDENKIFINAIGMLEHTPAQLAGIAPDKIPPLLPMLDQAFLHGFKITYWIGIGLSLLSISLIHIYLRNLPVPGRKDSISSIL